MFFCLGHRLQRSGNGQGHKQGIWGWIGAGGLVSMCAFTLWTLWGEYTHFEFKTLGYLYLQRLYKVQS